MKCSEKNSADSKERDLARKKLVSPGFLISPCSGDAGAVCPSPLALPGKCKWRRDQAKKREQGIEAKVCGKLPCEGESVCYEAQATDHIVFWLMVTLRSAGSLWDLGGKWFPLQSSFLNKGTRLCER